jgi:hypothetical protein
MSLVTDAILALLSVPGTSAQSVKTLTTVKCVKRDSAMSIHSLRSLNLKMLLKPSSQLLKMKESNRNLQSTPLRNTEITITLITILIIHLSTNLHHLYSLHSIMDLLKLFQLSLIMALNLKLTQDLENSVVKKTSKDTVTEVAEEEDGSIWLSIS